MGSFVEESASQRRKLDLSEFNVNLHGVVTKWLKKHGKGFKPKLSADQKEDLASVFKLMDEDGSGAIDVDELGAAFEMLGFNLKRSEILGFMAEVDHDRTGELEYNEFLEVMTESLARLSEKMIDSNRGNQNQVPFSLMTTAYKRKKLLKSILANTPESLALVVQCEQDLVASAKEKEKDACSAELRSHRSDDAQHLSALQRASHQSQLSPHMLVDLRAEELRAVASVSRRAEQAGGPPDAFTKRGGSGGDGRGSYGSPRPMYLPFLATPKQQRGPDASFKQQQQQQQLSPRSGSSSDLRQQQQPAASPRGPPPPPRRHRATDSCDPPPRRATQAGNGPAFSRSLTSPQSGATRQPAAAAGGRTHAGGGGGGDSPPYLVAHLSVERSSASSAALFPTSSHPSSCRPLSICGNELLGGAGAGGFSVPLLLPMKGSRLPKIFKAASMDKLAMLGGRQVFEI